MQETFLPAPLQFPNCAQLLSGAACQGKTDLKSSSTACGKVWKLLLRLIWVPSTMAIFPNICKPQAGPQHSSAATNCPQSNPVLSYSSSW